MGKRISEFDYIKRFSAKFTSNLPEDVLGIGDDCAVIPYNDEISVLYSTDTLIDGVHFLSSKMPPRDIAYKSLVVNLSDIAAMGGRPEYVLLAIAVPKDMDSDILDDFFAGFEDGCNQYGVFLIGGDTTKDPDRLTITVTVIGFAQKELIKLRSTAKHNDVICVTGNIGDSVGGLHCYLHDLGLDKSSAHYEKLKQTHLRPRPHIKEGLWLSRHGGVNAMIDISDGIESDIQRIMEASLCGAVIELDSLPLSKEFNAVANEQGWNSYEMAVTGGEDYCLLITIDQDCYDEVADAYNHEFGYPLTIIGKILPADAGLRFELNKKSINLNRRGYDHFR